MDKSSQPKLHSNKVMQTQLDGRGPPLFPLPNGQQPALDGHGLIMQLLQRRLISHANMRWGSHPQSTAYDQGIIGLVSRSPTLIRPVARWVALGRRVVVAPVARSPLPDRAPLQAALAEVLVTAGGGIVQVGLRL